MINLVIFGTGKCSDRVENVLYKDRVNIIAYLDNNIGKQGTKRNEIDILAPNQVNVLDYDYIIISTRRFQEVMEQLLRYHISEKKIIGYYEDNFLRNQELKDFINIDKWNRYVLQDKFDAELDNIKKRINNYMANMEYELADKIRSREYFFPKICQIEFTIQKIIEDGCSLCRFGDGEFELMESRARLRYQDVDLRLADRLKEVIGCEQENILIGIADNYGSLDEFTVEAANAIRSYMTKETRESHFKFLQEDKQYHNAYLSRPYMMYKDKKLSGKRFEQIKQIWCNRDIIIIEGESTRMGVGNDLFSKAKSVKRILAPNKNAFSVYEKIRDVALEFAKEKLFLLSLGPAATVLAYDLAQLGYQALDLGQIDNEYEWYLAKAEQRIPIPHKCVHEVRGGEVISALDDKEYDAQIVKKVS